MTQDRLEPNRYAIDPELTTWLEEHVKREVGRARRRDGRVLAGVALGLVLSLPLAGLALPSRNTFAAGQKILASEINENFKHLWDAVTDLEDAAEGFVVQTAADERYAPRSIPPIGDGFFDPLNGMSTEVNLPADAFTTVQSQSIEVPGPGRVIVIATAAISSAGSASAFVWFGVTGDGESENVVSTYAAMPTGLAQSLTVHGVFRVADAGVKLFSASALPPGVAAVSRSSHMTLLFVPD